MASAVATKPAGTAMSTKMKKPSIPYVQTNLNSSGKPMLPSSSPSSAAKRLPGQQPPATPATNGTTNPSSAARQNRRLQRLTTRASTTDNPALDRKVAKKFPEPYVAKESHILKKFKGRPPSLIVHLHPTHFRFDQQEGSFSYHSEMRVFIEHLQKGTIPHDMIEEFRKSEVQYYDGWLIVRVVDHRTKSKDAVSADGKGKDENLFSIHNYNQYITPSPYVAYPSKEQTPVRSSPTKQEPRDGSSGPNKSAPDGDIPSDDTVDVASKAAKPHARIFHVALRPTILSRHMDLVIDAMAPDPKAMNRKQSQANGNSRASTTVPQTPISGIPPTPSLEKGPPFKKQKMKIEAKDLIEYEARITNATAPPLYLDPVDNLEEAEALINLLKDPLYDAAPPSPRGRKRTVAELAAEDAYAKEQERFMLIMDDRNAGNTNTGNAAAIDVQTASTLFQPRFERFNALANIKREIAERKQKEKDRQLQEDENRRNAQERLQEEEKKKMMIHRQREMRLAQVRQQEAAAAAAAAQQQQQQQQQQQPQIAPQAQQVQMAQQQPLQQDQDEARQQRQLMQQQMQAQQQMQMTARAMAAQRGSLQPQQQPQVNGIPPQMQNQLLAAQQRSSPIVHHGTPQAMNSPIVNNVAIGGHPMAASTSQQGHGSPSRPPSALQHAHAAIQMARESSGQGMPMNGTPQMSNATPGMRTATPVNRQGSPVNITSASPAISMVSATPQMNNAGMMVAPMANGAQGVRPPMTAQQIADLQRRHALQQQALMQQQMTNGGTPQMSAAQIAHLQAQSQAQAERHAALQRHQAQQAAAAQAQQMQQQQQQMQNQAQNQMSISPSPVQTQNAYKQSVAEQMKAQMQSLQQGQHQGSPAPNHMTPQQQAAQMAQVQQQAQLQQRIMAQQQAQANMAMPNPQQQQAMMMAQGQPQQQQRMAMPPHLQQYYQQSLQAYTQRFIAQASAKYQGTGQQLNQQEMMQVQQSAKNAAMQQVRKRQAELSQAAQMRQAQQVGMTNPMNMNVNMNMNMHPNMAAALQQQQQQQAAQQMQQMHMQHAQAQMMAQAQAQAQQGNMSQMHAFQQQLQNMQQQQQQQGGPR